MDDIHVIKTNDAIFYLTWQDYNSLQLHNYFFPATSYELWGSIYEHAKLFAVLNSAISRLMKTPI
jgi:hypothetical protein